MTSPSLQFLSFVPNGVSPYQSTACEMETCSSMVSFHAQVPTNVYMDRFFRIFFPGIYRHQSTLGKLHLQSQDRRDDIARLLASHNGQPTFGHHVCLQKFASESVLGMLPDKLKAEIAIHVHLGKDCLLQTWALGNKQAGARCGICYGLLRSSEAYR